MSKVKKQSKTPVASVTPTVAPAVTPAASSEYDSPTLTYLQKYPVIERNSKQIRAVPAVEKTFAVSLAVLLKAKELLVDSPKSPAVAKKGYSLLKYSVHKFDNLFAIVVLQAGFDALFKEWQNHSNTPGLWLAWFYIDYLANVTNILLKEFVIKPFKLNTLSSQKNPEESSLPHVNELSELTQSISKDIQDKVHADYINPTKDIALQKYEALVKPTAEKLQSEYLDPTREKLNAQFDILVKPTYESAKETYQTVSTTYENNLSKTESIPRAIVTTGMDISNLTIEKLKQVSQNVSLDKQENKQI